MMEVSMTSTDASGSTSAQMPEAGTIDMKLEVVTLPVSDVDRAKRFYQSLGWRLDADIAVGDAFRVVQLTPTQSACSVAFGKGVTAGCSTSPGDLSPAPTRKAAPTRPTPRSAIRTATDGYSRRSRRGYPAGSGRTAITSTPTVS